MIRHCPEHPSARAVFTDPTGGDPALGGPVSLPICPVCRRQLEEVPDTPHEHHPACAFGSPDCPGPDAVTDVDAPSPGHLCSLPSTDGGYGSTGYPDGHLMLCRAGCGRWYVSRPCYESMGPTSWWVQVRWYHFRTRRRLRAAGVVA